MARLTLWGMYQYDNTLFDGAALPPPVVKADLINTIMSRCGDLYPYYQVPPQLKTNITVFFQRRYTDFVSMVKALTSEYNPIHNYDRTENRSETYKDIGTDSGTNEIKNNDQSKRSGKNGVEYSGEDMTDVSRVNQVSAYDSDSFSNREKQSDNQNVIYGKKENAALEEEESTTSNTNGSNNFTFDHSGGRNEEVKIAGNIGVTTTQQMIESEIEMRKKYDLYKIIAELFEDEFIVEVY